MPVDHTIGFRSYSDDMSLTGAEAVSWNLRDPLSAGFYIDHRRAGVEVGDHLEDQCANPGIEFKGEGT